MRKPNSKNQIRAGPRRGFTLPGLVLGLAFLAGPILHELPWGAFPYNQVRLLAVLGFLGMLLFFARTSPENGYAVWGVKSWARQAPEKITPAAAS